MNSGPIGVMFFCLGNICRSPLAEVLFRYHITERGLEDRFNIASSGTSSYHIGEPPDAGSIEVARERLGLDISDQRAQQLSATHLRDFDYIVAMDQSNLDNANQLEGADQTTLLLFRDFEPTAALRGYGVPDPWGGGSSQFEDVYEIVDRCAQALLDYIVVEESLS